MVSKRFEKGLHDFKCFMSCEFCAVSRSLDLGEKSCFKSHVGEVNFTTRIPFGAHVQLGTHDSVRTYIKDENPDQPAMIATLFGPPGMGKTDSIVFSTFLENSMYMNVTVSRTQLVQSLIRAFDTYLASVRDTDIKAGDLLRVLDTMSNSFMAILLPMITGRIQESRSLNLGCLSANGFSTLLDYGDALKEACRQFEASIDAFSWDVAPDHRRVVLHFDEMQALAVHREFVRAADSEEYVLVSERAPYRLISLSNALFSALTSCSRLRVVLSGTSQLVGHVLRVGSALKLARIAPLQASDSSFVERVLAFFLDLQHVSPSDLALLYDKLAGCRRSIQWFLESIQRQFHTLQPVAITVALIDQALSYAFEEFKAQTRSNLLASAEPSQVTNAVLLAFTFYEAYGGTLLDDGQSISFPSQAIPQLWHAWSNCGALQMYMSSSQDIVTVRAPYYFMRQYLLQCVTIVTASDKTCLQAFVDACVAQPQTMPGLAFQMAVAIELLEAQSALRTRIINVFETYGLSSPPPIPPVQLFSVLSDLEPSAFNTPHVWMVSDRRSESRRYVDVMCCLENDGKDSDGEAVKFVARMEVKRVTCVDKLTHACVAFFDQCAAAPAIPGVHFLNVFVSYEDMKLDRSGSNLSRIRQYLGKPDYRVLCGHDVFDGCSFPFHRLKPSQQVSDARAFHDSIMTSPMRKYFKK